MGKKKTDEWKNRAEELIRQGDNFKSVNKTLLQEHEQGIGGSTFRRFKASIYPEDARSEALSSLREKKQKQKQDKSILSPKAWSKQKQKEVDESVFAQVLNEAAYHFIPCPNKGLTKKDVEEINIGGAVTGLIVYYTNINLSHPIIVFAARTIMLVIKVRAMCFQIRQKVEDVKAKIKGTELYSPVLRGQEAGHSDD